MDDVLKKLLLSFKEECIKRFSERLQRIVVLQSGEQTRLLVVVDDLSEKEQYRLYRDSAEFALKNSIMLFVFPYSSSDMRRREALAFTKRFLSEGEEI